METLKLLFVGIVLAVCAPLAIYLLFVYVELLIVATEYIRSVIGRH